MSKELKNGIKILVDQVVLSYGYQNNQNVVLINKPKNCLASFDFNAIFEFLGQVTIYISFFKKVLII